MPYGTISTVTRDWLVARAARDGITEDQLGLEPELPDLESEAEEVPIPDNLYEISITFDGALDEVFYVQTDYEVNIADWLAEQCAEESAKQEGESWRIDVAFYSISDDYPGEYKYWVES